MEKQEFINWIKKQRGDLLRQAVHLLNSEEDTTGKSLWITYYRRWIFCKDTYSWRQFVEFPH